MRNTHILKGYPVIGVAFFQFKGMSSCKDNVCVSQVNKLCWWLYPIFVVMKQILVILVLSIVATTFANGQTWQVFTGDDGYSKGFMNDAGQIMIAPKFMGGTIAKKFNNIIAVMEEVKDSTVSYYLLKNGMKVGVDSMYIDDMMFDCEREGAIRFRDNVTDKVGFFDKEGKVLIPAIYSEAFPFRNNVAVVIKDAQRICMDGSIFNKETKPFQYWEWKGGQTLLIDKQNHVLIHDFKPYYSLDYYSMKIDDTTDLPYRIIMKGEGGHTYSFNDGLQVFKNWLFADFISGMIGVNDSLNFLVAERKLLAHSFPTIHYYNANEVEIGARKVETKDLIKRNIKYLGETFLALQQKEANFLVILSVLDRQSFSEPIWQECKTYIWLQLNYEKYFDDCGSSFSAKYPTYSVIINKEDNSGKYQEEFSFLKTEEGYKFIGVSSPNLIR